MTDTQTIREDPAPSTLVSGEVNNSTLIMGRTGSGKSGLLATLARWVWEHYGKVTVLCATDGGGYPQPVQALIRKGIIRLFRLRSRSGIDDALALETCILASRGYLPARIDPLTGNCDPDARMVPPQVPVWDVITANGEVSRTEFSEAAAEKYRAQSAVIRRRYAPNAGFAEIGAYVFDGLTSTGSWIVDDLAARQGRAELAGEKGAIGGIVMSGTLKIGGGNRAHVGFGQRRVQQIVLNAQTIPNLVVPVCFTSLLLDTSDDASLLVTGPKLPGIAMTDEAPQWFGNVLETACYQDGSGRPCFRLYLADYVEATPSGARRHLCKNRGTPGALPPQFNDPPPEQSPDGRWLYPHAWSAVNLGRFFEQLEHALDVSVKQLDAQAALANAPGVGEVMEYGGVSASSPLPVAVTAPGARQVVGAAASPPAPQPLPEVVAAVATAAASAVALGAPGPASTPPAPWSRRKRGLKQPICRWVTE